MIGGASVLIRAGWLGYSAQVDRRLPGALLALGGLCVAGMVLNVAIGEFPIPPVDVVRALLGFETVDPQHLFVARELRLPRAIVGLLVGAALGVSGALLQGLTRNPLASPDIMGITAGAALAAVTLIVVLPGIPLAIRPAGAFLGAALPTISIYLLARRGRATPIRLVLVGVGISSIASALTTIVLVRGQVVQVSQALVWMAGSVYARSWEHIMLLLPWVLTIVPLAVLAGRHLDALALGDDVAIPLGTLVERTRGLLLLAAILLAGAAVATAGTVGFVALAAPHLARRLVGPTHLGLLPIAALVGAAIVSFADLVARSLFAPIEIPCGVVTAAVGGPYLLYLLARGRHG
jgi:iron complex transport system permease protein